MIYEYEDDDYTSQLGDGRRVRLQHSEILYPVTLDMWHKLTKKDEEPATEEER